MDILKNLFGPASKKRPSTTIFIVEDNNSYARFLKNFLMGRFSAIRECKIFPVGETCLLELNKNPDLIIMDYYLDSKYTDAANGVDAIKEIRKVKADLPIILLSAKNNDQHLVEASREYNCYYIKKNEEAFYKVEAIVKRITGSAYNPATLIGTDIRMALKRSFNKLSGKALAFFD